MMKTIILSIALFLSLSVSSTHAQTKQVSDKFNTSLESYYSLKNALAADQFEDAGKAALVLQAALKAVPHQGFANDAQHELWMEQSALIRTGAGELAKAADIKSQRKSFEGISTSFIKLTEALKINKKDAFVQYCPMGRFSWLSDAKAIQNPYYGSEMYDCGTVKSTIAKK